ncbi:ribose-phosphate pyrophosphokinase-like domain-containing protein [Thauera sp.]|uniref:ribose-phosphate pyrophosphokinase-like domain-containing protein n=1 Tax=Thauera sp. TaxID=1905334 RepID=UPI0039E3CBDF
MDTLLLHFDDETLEAERLARAVGVECAVIERHSFPDDELHLRLPQSLPSRVVVYRSLHRPNEKLLELLLVVRAAGRRGAEHVTLVAPYLAGLRRDDESAAGEAGCEGIVGGFLAGLFDAVLTADPYPSRVSSLAEAVPVLHAHAALPREAGVEQGRSTGCDSHPNKAACLAPRLAEALRAIHAA